MKVKRKLTLERGHLETFRRIASYIAKGYKLKFIVVIMGIVFSAISNVGFSLYLEILIDDYIKPLIGVENPVFTPLLMSLGVMAVIGAFGAIGSYLFNRTMGIVAQDVQKEIRDEMFGKMQELPVKYFDTHPHGETMSLYTNDIDTLRQMLSQSIPQILFSLITIVMVLITMLRTSMILTGVVLVGVVLMSQVTRFLTGRSGRYFQGQQESLAKMNGFVEEHVSGIKVVKVFCHEPQTKTDFDSLNEELAANATSANVFASVFMPVMMNLGNILYVIIAILGSFLAIKGLGLSMGAIVAFLHLTQSFTDPITRVSSQFNSIIMALVGADRLFSFIDIEPEQDEGYVTLINAKLVDGEIEESVEQTGMWAWKHPHGDGHISYTRLKGEVEFEHVDFAYEKDKYVLNDIDFSAHSGDKVALVGATGAGKTTITNLINRFYQINDGKIRYDNINIDKISKANLRRSLGIVLQDTNLFTGSIKDNIKYGKLDATDDEVAVAAKLVNAHGFIKRLPQGYDTVISGSSESLSQGQRQLLSIARVAIANPPLMILDEATSSIDTHTEQIVQSGMDKLMEGRTVLVIAHRLSTIQNSDSIIVLEHGRIIEQGDHDQLIAEKGQYYQLYTGAFELQ